MLREAVAERLKQATMVNDAPTDFALVAAFQADRGSKQWCESTEGYERAQGVTKVVSALSRIAYRLLG
jgi:hypothetical protein